MPSYNFNIGRWVNVSFHRSDAERERGGTAKESALAKRHSLDKPSSITAHRHRIEFAKVTPELALPTIAAVNRELRRLPFAAGQGELMRSIARSLLAHAATHGRMPRRAIVAETHGASGSLAAACMTLEMLAEVPGRKLLLLENQPTFLREVGLDDPGSDFIESTANQLSMGETPDIESDGATPYLRAASLNLATLCALAHERGFEVIAFDAGRNAGNLDLREAAGNAAIDAATAGADTALIVTGYLHASVFQAASRAQGIDTWLAAPVLDDVLPGDTLLARRMSSLLAEPDPHAVLRRGNLFTERLTSEIEFPALLDLVDSIRAEFANGSLNPPD